jgi:hypothetical protein
MGWRRKTHMHLGYNIALDNTAYVHIESMYNVTILLAVTVQEASWQKRQRHRSSR